MSFASLNGVNAARTMAQPKPSGMMGSAPMGPQQAPPVPLGRVNTSTPLGRSMAGFVPQDHAAGTGMLGTSRAASDYVNGGQSMGGGVMPGVQGPQLAQPAPMQFDPNDPNNAALAGYMAR